MLKNLSTIQEIQASYRVFQVLRPHLDQNTFVEQAMRQLAHGYIITAIVDDELVMSAVGYRFMEALAWGKYIYVDDLITHPDARGKGYAGQLLNFVRELAIENQLDAVHLDSGHTRFAAHRVYLNHGYKIAAHHFYLDLHRND